MMPKVEDVQAMVEVDRKGGICLKRSRLGLAVITDKILMSPVSLFSVENNICSASSREKAGWLKMTVTLPSDVLGLARNL